MGLFSLLGGAVGAGSSIFSSFQQRKQQQKQFEQGLQFQREENQLNRDWNSMQAEKANKWAQQAAFDSRNFATQWQERYNTPEAQMRMFKEAGLNPDLAISGGAGGITNAPMSTAQTFQSAASSPSDILSNSMKVAPTALAGTQMAADIAKTFSDIENIRADTAKKQGEITSIDLDNIRKAATNGSMIELDNFQVTLAKQAASLNDSQLSVLSQQLNNMKSENDLCNQKIQESISSVKNMDSVTLNNRISSYFASSRFDMEVKQFQQSLKESDSRINLSNAEAKEILTLVTAKKLNIDSDTLLKKAGVSASYAKQRTDYLMQQNLKIQGRQLEFNLDNDETFKSAERTTDIVTKALGAVSNIIGTVTKVRGLR